MELFKTRIINNFKGKETLNTVDFIHGKNKNTFSFKLTIRGENAKFLFNKLSPLIKGTEFRVPVMSKDCIELTRYKDTDWQDIVPEMKKISQNNGFFFRETKN